ncbi:MAG: DUF559 domain-containing protein [Bifidobacteriaceae bacterium]|jgi:hypothetical protein|nr:DUF559 domain-containing protein [Bifidobacteriaceae bacterium]
MPHNLEPKLVSLFERALDAIKSCPQGAITGAAGLILAGCELPPRLEKQALAGPIHVSLPRGATAGKEVVAHRHANHTGVWKTVAGVPIATPGDCLAQIACDTVAARYIPPNSRKVPWESLSRRGKVTRLRRILGLAKSPYQWTNFVVDPHLAFLELVMAADSLMRRANPLISKADLTASIAELGPRSGVRVLRRALARSEPGTDSNPETWMRLVLIDAGAPRGIVNQQVAVPNSDAPKLLDLRLRGYAAALEYQGAYHFETEEQRRRDMRRREELRSAGFVMIEVWNDDLRNQNRVVVRVAEEVARFEGVRLPASKRPAV